MKNIIFLILSLFLIACSNQYGSKISQDDNNYSGSGVEKLYVSNISGDIEVDKWDSNQIRVKITKRSFLEVSLDDIDTDIHKGKTFKVEAKCNNPLSIDNVYVKYKIYVPENIEVECKNVSGDIIVGDVSYIDKLSTTSGNINVDIDNMKGDVEITTTSGNIKADINNMTDDVKITTTSGNIQARVKDGIYKKIEASTTSGNVNIDGLSKKSTGEYEIKLKATSGNIDVDEKK